MEDGDLKELLAASGCKSSVDEVRDIAAGVAAAPRAVDPNAWMQLVCEEVSGTLETALSGLLDEHARDNFGLDDGPAKPKRIAALRSELKHLGIDGFVVPRCDEHQGEYVAPRAERLAWVTGFTGSAGQAIILADQAAIFVDGRYTLQAASQVDTDLVEVRHFMDEPASDWIAANLPAKGVLAYDPWLHTPAQVAKLKEAVVSAGGELRALDTNPVDAVWPDQPPPPLSPVVSLPRRFIEMPSDEKRKRVGADLAAAGVGAAVLTAPDSIAWLLNVRGGDVPFTPFCLSFMVLTEFGEADWFVDRRKFTPGLTGKLGDGVRVRPVDELGDALDRLGEEKCKVRVASATVPEWIFRRLTDAGAGIDRGDDPCQLTKARKGERELQGMRDAHLRDGATLTRFLAWLDTEGPSGSVTEISAADKLESIRRENELFSGLSFSTISGAGPNGAVVHYRVTEASNRHLEPGTLYLVDSGAQYLDGTTDVTRTVAIGEPTEEMRRAFTLVLKGHIALARTRFPRGTTGSQLDVLARHALWQAGLDYDHGTGHGVGTYLSVHEGPHRISKAGSTVALEPGMVVSNEPGYYKQDAFGIRIENLVAVTAQETPEGGERELLGFETLTLAPIDRRLVDAGLLNEDERSWLDAYHAQVRSALSPLLEAETGAWLETATAAITG